MKGFGKTAVSAEFPLLIGISLISFFVMHPGAGDPTGSFYRP